jgi:hypothetical protein
MYEEIVAEVNRTTEAAVQESKEHVDLAGDRNREADTKATEATKAIGERWQNRINAMRRRFAERENAKTSNEMSFGQDDEGHPGGENDELTSLTEQSSAPAADEQTTAYGISEDAIAAQSADTYGRHAPGPESSFVSSFGPSLEDEQPAVPPRRTSPARRTRPRDDDDDDFSGQSWLRDS